MISKFRIAHDPDLYHGWPDVALCPSGKLVCVFSECTHHGNRDYTRIMLVDSNDRGRTWTPKRPLTEGTRGQPYYYNCARINALRDGRLVILVDRIPVGGEAQTAEHSVNLLFFSADEGKTWGNPMETPLRGIVPDKLLELETGRWIIAAHHPESGFLTQFLRYSDDQGKSWSDRITVAKKQGLNLCEVSILPVGDTTLVAFMRENSFQGWDCKKTISNDNGQTWGEVIDFPLPACHRPVAGHLHDGRVLITYRFMQGGKGGFGYFMQNFFAALTDDASALALKRSEAWARIMPIDFDRSSRSDLGYSGWVQFPDGEIYVVNYIVDDAIDKAQIRGYSLRVEDFLLKL
jgi:hypothetical protein